MQPGDGHWSMPSMHRVAAPSTTLSGEYPATQSAASQPSHLYGWAHSLGCLAESHPIHLPSLHDGEESFFSRFGAIR